VPAAAWDEREAHDLYGVDFVGHAPLRPLVTHPGDLASWTVPVEGRDTFQVAVGPIHAGVIESGHFRFHVVGERILHLDLQLFYKHRGLERAAEGRTLAEGLAYAQRACAACNVANGVAYAQACESALGLLPTVELARARTLALELERLYNHLHDIGAACAGVGFALGTNAFAFLKEQVQRQIALLVGHRFLFGAVAVGESRLAITAAQADEARQVLKDVGIDARRAWHEVLFNASVQDRLVDIGSLTGDVARALGTVGPAARASGLGFDVRAESPRLLYTDFHPATLRHPAGDVASRVNMRALEVDATLELLDRLLALPLSPATATPGAEPRPVGVSRVESPRGETLAVVHTDGGRIARLHLKTASLTNWPSLARAVSGNILPDFPLINKSFELCYACADR
jgi:Ni,Fe-hydrogenase III large subunit